MKKKMPTAGEEMLELRRRIENLEMKLSMIREPLLIDAMAYAYNYLKDKTSGGIQTANKRKRRHFT